jgi:hypothetical protein
MKLSAIRSICNLIAVLFKKPIPDIGDFGDRRIVDSITLLNAVKRNLEELHIPRLREAVKAARDELRAHERDLAECEEYLSDINRSLERVK